MVDEIEEKRLKREALGLRERLEKEFAESVEKGEVVEETISKIVRRPAGRSTSFLNISKEKEAYVAARGPDIIIDEFGNKKINLY